VKFVGIADHSDCAIVLGPLGGLLGGLAGSIVGFLQAPDYSRAPVSHVADLPAAERRNQLLQAVRLSLLHAGGATNANKFASPQQFKETLLQFAAQQQVSDQIRKAFVDVLDVDRH
jgi:hypothetical protein